VTRLFDHYSDGNERVVVKNSSANRQIIITIDELANTISTIAILLEWLTSLLGMDYPTNTPTNVTTLTGKVGLACGDKVTTTV